MRRYGGEDDFWRIRAFLREVFLANDRRERCWQPSRLDYWRWHGIENCRHCPSVDAVTFLWETKDGRLRAVLNAESRGEASLQVHPDAKSVQLEAEMLDIAEAHLTRSDAAGNRQLEVWVNGVDSPRQALLRERGYEQPEWAMFEYRRLLTGPIPEAAPAPGYAVRSLGTREELPARSWASWRAFHPNEPDDAYEGWEWYLNIQRMPLYRRDLDIVATAPDGTVAAFCTLWLDDVTRAACFEPVGTMPEHQRRGLAKAIMCEGMRRVQRMGATVVTVAGGSPAANALYASVMSPEYERAEPWKKTW
jgi:ribosomal protein S18 acetylase RimI-like enzyme